MTRIRPFLLLEAASFAAAALVHFGVLLDGYQHRKAGTAESVIGAVLLLGLAASWVRPARTRTAGLWAQGFALLGTCVGLFTIAIGVGPRTVPDLVYHASIVAVLIGGLVAAARTRPGPGESAEALRAAAS
jgi:hypothetical protein